LGTRTPPSSAAVWSAKAYLRDRPMRSANCRRRRSLSTSWGTRTVPPRGAAAGQGDRRAEVAQVAFQLRRVQETWSLGISTWQRAPMGLQGRPVVVLASKQEIPPLGTSDTESSAGGGGPAAYAMQEGLLMPTPAPSGSRCPRQRVSAAVSPCAVDREAWSRLPRRSQRAPVCRIRARIRGGHVRNRAPSP